MLRLVCLLWVGLTIIINIYAFAGVLSAFGMNMTDWQAPFSTLGNLYSTVASPIYNVAADMLTSRFDVTLPAWSIHALLAYASTASAIAVSGMGIASRSDLVDSLKSSGLSIAWPMGIVFLIWKAVRAQLVTKFIRDHGLIVLIYAALVLGGYVGARYVNNNVLIDKDVEITTSSVVGADESLFLMKQTDEC